jgi:hypothetical protein
MDPTSDQMTPASAQLAELIGGGPGSSFWPSCSNVTVPSSFGETSQ